MLGKRKRDTKVLSRSTQNAEPPTSAGATISNTEFSHNIFRRHFEAAFAPLPGQKEIDEVHDESSDFEEDSDVDIGSEVSEWSGLSEIDTQQHNTSIVEVIDHATPLEGEGKEDENDDNGEFHRARQKAFMSSRPPREKDDRNKNISAKKPAKPSEEEKDPTEKLNLKHDLDLQRLLRESHLLGQQSHASSSMTPGTGRQLALDMRLQALGAKESIYTQRTMPRAQRVGISKKAESREATRRREAKENGIVLERAAGSTNNSKKKAMGMERRVRGVDVPGVGRFSGGTLKLSRMDIANIQGTRSGPAAVGRRKGKRS